MQMQKLQQKPLLLLRPLKHAQLSGVDEKLSQVTAQCERVQEEARVHKARCDEVLSPTFQLGTGYE